MTEVLPAVAPEVMEALQAALAAEVDAHARASVLAQMRDAKPKFQRFYWGERNRDFQPVVDAVFGPGTWRAGMPIDIEVSPAVATRLSGEQVAEVPRRACQCPHCHDQTCQGDCPECEDYGCRQCYPDGGPERTCECDNCDDNTCQGDCDRCEEYGCQQCHPDLYACCGYCENCERCHTEERDRYGGQYCEHCNRCAECGHTCND
jgi:hypothetical protein